MAGKGNRGVESVYQHQDFWLAVQSEQKKACYTSSRACMCADTVVCLRLIKRTGRKKTTMKETERNYTYMLKCGDGSLYTGWTNDIVGRLAQHRSGKGAKYTRGRGPLELVYLEVYDTKSEAMSREARIKHFSRNEKLQLLKSNDWKDALTEKEMALILA